MELMRRQQDGYKMSQEGRKRRPRERQSLALWRSSAAAEGSVNIERVDSRRLDIGTVEEKPSRYAVFMAGKERHAIRDPWHGVLVAE